MFLHCLFFLRSLTLATVTELEIATIFIDEVVRDRGRRCWRRYRPQLGARPFLRFDIEDWPTANGWRWRRWLSPGQSDIPWRGRRRPHVTSRSTRHTAYKWEFTSHHITHRISSHLISSELNWSGADCQEHCEFIGRIDWLRCYRHSKGMTACSSRARRARLIAIAVIFSNNFNMININDF